MENETTSNILNPARWIANKRKYCELCLVCVKKALVGRVRHPILCYWTQPNPERIYSTLATPQKRTLLHLLSTHLLPLSASPPPSSYLCIQFFYVFSSVSSPFLLILVFFLLLLLFLGLLLFLFRCLLLFATGLSETCSGITLSNFLLSICDMDLRG